MVLRIIGIVILTDKTRAKDDRDTTLLMANIVCSCAAYLSKHNIAAVVSTEREILEMLDFLINKYMNNKMNLVM